MKIAFFTDCYLDLTGGITSSINAQKTALEDNGHTVYIFSTGFPRSRAEKEKLSQQNIFQVPSCKIFFRGLSPISRRPHIIEKWLLKTHPEIKEFDIFYIHYESGCSIAGLRLGKRLKIPTVQVMHGREDMGESNIIPFGLRTLVACFLNWFHSWYIHHSILVHQDQYLANTIAKARMWTLMVNHANYADLVLSPSEQFRKKLIHYGVKKTIKVFPNGFPDDKLPKCPTLKKLEPGEELKMIWHSRVSAEKRMMPFLNALKDVCGRYRLDVYGGGGDYFRAKRFARRNHLNVKFHGNVTFLKLSKVIERAHLDVLVSYNFDTFGMTLIEAEAFGVPAIICDPDLRETIPRESFVISDSPMPSDMAKTINDLLNKPQKISQMSQVMISHRHEILISNRIKILEKIFYSIMKS